MNLHLSLIHRLFLTGGIFIGLSCLLILAIPPLPAAADDWPPPPTSSLQINEVSFAPAPGAYEWVELQNNGKTAMSLDRHGLTNEEGNWYWFYSGIPPVPPGARVLVIFDGKGRQLDEYDYSDELAILHTPPGLVDIFENNGGQCGLYHLPLQIFLPVIIKGTTAASAMQVESYPEITPMYHSPVIDFIAWGKCPGEKATRALFAGVWAEFMYVSLYPPGAGFYREPPQAKPNGSVGRAPGFKDRYQTGWLLYAPDDTTPGQPNHYPDIVWIDPIDGATIDGSAFWIDWFPVPGAVGYQFQLDAQSDFTSLLTDTISTTSYFSATNIPNGFYYWRVKTIFEDSEGAWITRTIRVQNILTAPLFSAAASPTTDIYLYSGKKLNLIEEIPHKDTHMLCLGGDDEKGFFPWDAPHPETNEIAQHAWGYCSEVAFHSWVAYYGGNLSQDRLAYYVFSGSEYTGTLGHNNGVGYEKAKAAIAWALGTQVDIHIGKPPFDQIKIWLDEERPIGEAVDHHFRLIDGYLQLLIGGEIRNFVHLVDGAVLQKWVLYEDEPLQEAWIGPTGPQGAPHVRSDEDENANGIPDTNEDSDGDGLCNFDEIHRFHLDPFNDDTDHDRVIDKPDLRDYMYDELGRYTLRPRDMDHDGYPKELDSDNDSMTNSSLWDGAEDTNLDGMKNPYASETSNFDSADDFTPHIHILAPPTQRSTGDGCIVEIQGFVMTNYPLRGSVEIFNSRDLQPPNFHTAPTIGSPPYYTFTQALTISPGSELLIFRATNQFGTGETRRIANITCE